jgi:alanine racemase
MLQGPSRATVDLDALSHNVAAIRRASGGVPLIAVVKADAYGHGSVAIARALLSDGVGQLAVATVAEGAELRAAGIEAPILVFGASVSGNVETLVGERLSPVVTNAEQVVELAEVAASLQGPVATHLHVETGMHRLGCAPANAVALGAAIDAAEGLELVGVMTHLGCADEPDEPATTEQLACFDQVLEPFAGRGLQRHAFNSGAIFGQWQQRYEAVRPGLALYGVPPCAAAQGLLRPVLSWHCRVGAVRQVGVGERIGYGGRFVATRPTRVGILPVGYADGYPWAAEGHAHVLVGGQVAPVVGAVSMDLLTVDLTDLPNSGAGSKVTLIGESIGAPDLARWGRRSNYEILTGLGARIQRTTTGGAQ